MIELAWTREPPSQPGLYLWRSTSRARIRVVRFGFDEYLVGLVGIEHYRRELPEDFRGRRPTSFRGEFLGPLPE